MNIQPQTDVEKKDAGCKFQGLVPANAVRVYPIAINDHVSCPHYLDKKEVKFLHLTITAEAPYSIEKVESFVLFFLLSGRCLVKTSEVDNPIDVQAGKMLFISAGGNLTISGAPVGECILLRFTEVSFCDNLSLQNLAQQTGFIKPDFETCPIAPPLMAFLHNIIFYTDNQVNCYHLQHIKQNECFILLRICYSKEMLARIFAPLLCEKDLILKMKIQRFASQIHTVTELADRCEMSEVKMKRKIRKLFGIPAYKWILRQRNRQILYDLRNGRTPKEICFLYDYSSLSNFAAYCKRQFGLPPSRIIKLSVDEYQKLQQRVFDE